MSSKTTNMNNEITHKKLLSVLSYNEKTGVFKWKKITNRHISVGMVAGSVGKVDGYRAIRIERRAYRASRLAWFYVYKKWPLNYIDHINGIRTDDRICNLRDVLPVENQHNLCIHRAGKLVVSSYSKAERKWKAQIKINGKSVYLGSFKNEIDAHNMYKAALRNKDKYKGSDSVFRLKLTKADQMLKEMNINKGEENVI